MGTPGWLQIPRWLVAGKVHFWPRPNSRVAGARGRWVDHRIPKAGAFPTLDPGKVINASASKQLGKAVLSLPDLCTGQVCQTLVT